VTKGFAVIRERRKSDREQQHKIAWLAQGNRVKPAMVIDMSEGGLKLTTPFGIERDKDFILAIGEDDFVAVCQLAWVDGATVGARFIKTFGLERSLKKNTNRSGLAGAIRAQQFAKARCG
jgi:hypothetical protein